VEATILSPVGSELFGEVRWGLGWDELQFTWKSNDKYGVEGNIYR